MQFGGAFWQSIRGLNFTSHSFDQLLSQESTTLSNVLDDDNVIQELRNQNQKLHDFFNVEKISELVKLITVFPPEDADNNRGYKHPFIASELFSTDSSYLLGMFFEEQRLMEELFSFLSCDPINSTLSGYFSKLVISLITKNPAKIIEFIDQRDFLQPIAQNICNKSITDLALKILIIENSEPSFCLNSRIKLLSLIIDQLSQGSSLSHYYAGEVLSEVLSKGGEVNSWRDLASFIVSGEKIKIIIDCLASDESSKIIASVKILKVLMSSSSCDFLLRSIKPAGDDDSRVVQEDEEISEFLKSVINSFGLMVHRLKRPHYSFESTQSGVSTLMLGEDRLKIIELFLSCIKLDINEVENKIVESGFLHTIIDLFDSLHLNSLLQNAVDQIISAVLVLNNEDNELITELFSTNFIKKFVESDSTKGNYGYIVKISNVLVKAQNSKTKINQLLEKTECWSDFVNTKLKRQNEIDRKALGESKKVDSYDDDSNSDERIATLLKKANIDKPEKHDSNDLGEINDIEKEPEEDDFPDKFDKDDLLKPYEEAEKEVNDEAFNFEEIDNKPDFTQTVHLEKRIVEPSELTETVIENKPADNDSYYWRFGYE